jgi:signal transduction histidine kinase
MNISSSQNVNLIIVDDTPENLQSLEIALEREGLKIFTTTSPQHVLQLCIDHHISIALIDVRMPVMDGFELLDIIKSDPKTMHILVVLITGYSNDAEQVVAGLKKGAVDYLFKPLDLYITNAKVDSLITLVNYQNEIQKKNIQLENYQAELIKAIGHAEKGRIIKENFLANMSHEIRTPLNSLTGLTYLLLDTPLNKEQREIIRLMSYSAKALLGIVDDILDSSKLDAGKIRIVRAVTDIRNLIETICDLTRPMAHEKGLEINCTIDTDVPAMIMADALRLNQILMNLINNAIKFTARGSINVALRLLEKTAESAVLEFTVSDTGIGIPPRALNKIFNRFEQVDDSTWRKFGGTGLGLSIVKSLIELKGGTLAVTSKVNEGTRFNFQNRFALADHFNPKEEHPEMLQSIAKFEDTSILLAEDNIINQFLVIQMLKKWNIRVDVASDGAEAIKKLKENDYDLILMDTHMPVMDGLEATRQIRQNMSPDKKDIPIISFSASVIEKEKNEAMEAGVSDFIGKPFDPLLLHSKISALIEKNRDE